MNEITKRRIHRGKDPFRIVQILKREVEKNKKSIEIILKETNGLSVLIFYRSPLESCLHLRVVLHHFSRWKLKIETSTQVQIKICRRVSLRAVISW